MIPHYILLRILLFGLAVASATDSFVTRQTGKGRATSAIEGWILLRHSGHKFTNLLSTSSTNFLY